jgi:4a-hydroxytetrahydrobiopterin dehydratase
MLNQEQCEACRAGAPLVGRDEQLVLLTEIPLWSVQTFDSIERLVREFTFSDFVQAQSFANAVADLAEALNHHPKIVLEWGRVEVSWWTHKIRGLHRNDFVAAAKTDLLY